MWTTTQLNNNWTTQLNNTVWTHTTQLNTHNITTEQHNWTAQCEEHIDDLIQCCNSTPPHQRKTTNTRDASGQRQQYCKSASTKNHQTSTNSEHYNRLTTICPADLCAPSGVPLAEVVGVTFSDSSVPVPKFLKPDPIFFEIWGSDLCPLIINATEFQQYFN